MVLLYLSTFTSEVCFAYTNLPLLICFPDPKYIIESQIPQRKKEKEQETISDSKDLGLAKMSTPQLGPKKMSICIKKEKMP